jgi:hypothetical protein
VLRAFFASVALIAAVVPAGWAAEVSIRLDGGVFHVVNWTADREPAGGWESILSIYAESRSADPPPLLGAYSVENGALTFKPRFPLAAGMHYRAVFRVGGNAQVVADFDGPKLDRTSSTRVEHVYPSTNTLPANQLKFYLFFSAPMARGEAWRRIHLLDQDGKEVELPFLELNQELWDPDYKRLTVLFDPGRIKRGLVPTNEVGPPLIEGRAYTLVIDQDWMDARGVRLIDGFRKQFHVIAADRTAPESKNWHLTIPKAGTRDPVILNFGKPMDYALLNRLVDIPGMKGTATIDHDESEWRFVPDRAWRTDEDRAISVDSSIEDLAGNRPGRLFDVDTFDRITDHTAHSALLLRFRVH